MPKLGPPRTDAETGEEVIGDSEDGRLVLELDPVGRNQADQGDEDDEGGVEPVDMLVPVGPCDGLFCDVCRAIRSAMVLSLVRSGQHVRGLRMS